MTYKERMMAAIKGEIPDVIPYAPRLDLWYAAHSAADTLPVKYKNSSVDEICRAEGWGLYKVTADYKYIQDSAEDIALVSLGLFALPMVGYRFNFSSEIKMEVKQEGDTVMVKFHTPVGMVSSVLEYTEQLKKEGITYPWVKERLIKEFDDWKIVAYLFENMKLIPDWDGYLQWVEEIGHDGLGASPASDASSPMHHIQKTFFAPTDFYIYYKERAKELEAFAASVANYYDQLLDVVAESPAEVITWGGNYDDTITYPPYFEKEILPWLKKAANALRQKGKLLLTHCDGENYGLMELIKNSGVDAAESVCPHPMTKLRLHEYYERWADNITIIGGIPAELVIRENTSDTDFEAYMDYMFKAVAPGRRFFAGISDAVPVFADFDRLRQINELIEAKGKLPLEEGSFRPVFDEYIIKREVEDREKKITEVSVEYTAIRQDIFTGNSINIKTHIEELLQRDIPAEDILQEGMVSAMEIIGERFSSGEVFIPEMLMAAKTMEAGVSILKDKLMKSAGKGTRTGGKIVLGTVFGDLHDIGKNLVGIMLRGVGFDVVDLGVNVSIQEFIKQAKTHNPKIMALSALLTTTMPQMQKLIQALHETGLRSSIKVMIGGAPVTPKFADQIGADGYAANAGDAVPIAKKLVTRI